MHYLEWLKEQHKDDDDDDDNSMMSWPSLSSQSEKLIAKTTNNNDDDMEKELINKMIEVTEEVDSNKLIETVEEDDNSSGSSDETIQKEQEKIPAALRKLGITQIDVTERTLRSRNRAKNLINLVLDGEIDEDLEEIAYECINEEFKDEYPLFIMIEELNEHFKDNNEEAEDNDEEEMTQEFCYYCATESDFKSPKTYKQMLKIPI